MKRTARLRIFSSALLLALMVAAALPLAAFADEGEPPPAPTETATPPDPEVEEQGSQGENSVDEEAPPADEDQTTATEDAPVYEATVSEQNFETEVDAESEASLLAEIPADTEVVVLDESGNQAPLASAEAAEIIAGGGDPIWCPATVATPVSGGMGCTTSYLSLQALITALTGAEPSVDGVIWIEGSYDSSSADLVTVFTFDGNTLTTMRNYKLTIRGGWNGIGTNTINTGNPSDFVNDRLVIIRWLNDVTISDITITAAAGTGLNVTTTKNIILTRVSSNSNTGGGGRGAFLDNASDFGSGTGTGSVSVTGGTFNGNASVGGIRIFSNGNITLNSVIASGNLVNSFGAQLDNTSGTGNISVTNSTFNSNVNSGGLIAGSHGTITLSSVTATGNTGQGVGLNNSTAPLAKAVTVTGTNAFNGNTGIGIVVSSKGGVTLSGVSALSNTGGNGGNISNTFGVAAVSITNSHFDSNTSGGGLFVVSNSSITLSGVTVSSNSGGSYGAILDSSGGLGAVTITNSHFDGNATGGLTVYAKTGITLTTVTASGNSAGGLGALLNNYAGGLGTGNISVTSSSFNTNTFTAGLQAYSNGMITLTSVIANGNTGYGAYLLNNSAPTAKAVTIAGTNNQFNTNSSTGLVVFTKGNISISNVTASSNTSGGASLDASTGAGTVMVTAGTFNLNPGFGGLYVSALGNISLATVTANQNTVGYGAKLINTAGTGNITITNGTFNLNAGIDGGIQALSKGVITLTTVTANGNTSGNGASLDNGTASTAKAITLNGTNEFSSNRNNGLAIAATGAITVNNATANYNGISGSSGSGALLYNTYLSLAVGVTVNGANIFAGNYNHGLDIASYGFVKLNSISAISNSHGYGTQVNNVTTAAAQPVTITGTNLFKFNRDGGLNVYSDGLITASNLTANSNGPTVTASGVYLNNNSVGNTAGINITGFNVLNNNAFIGLNVHSRGTISVSSVTANDNGLIGVGPGVSLDNQTAVAHLGVTVSGTNMFEGNSQAGLSIFTHGAITVNSVTSINSVASLGVLLDNTAGGFTTANMAVNLTGTNVISNNYSTGLDVISYGAITINNVTANNNGAGGFGGAGVQLYNLLASTPKAVTANGVNSTNNNDSTGFYVLTKGPIKVNSLTASGNGSGLVDYGAVLNNNAGTTANSITLTGTNVFNNNYTGGLRALATGAIALNSITASGNLASHGLEATNAYLGTAFPQNVTLTGTNVFNDNYSSGVEVLTYGAISANSVTANGNGTSAAYGFGAYLNNLGADPLVLPLKGVTVSGTNQFNDNYDSGLVIMTLGAITGNNISASGNGTGSDDGVYLENFTAPSPMDVKLTGINVSSSSSGSGFAIWTDGAVTLNSVTATSNGTGGSGHGLFIQNYYTAGKNVTLTGTNNFISNDDYGLQIYSSGVISVSNMIASFNVSGTGAILDNYSFAVDPPTPHAVTVSGINTFNNNNLTGLSITSRGVISISSVTASNNGDYGAQLNNGFSSTPQAVNLIGLNKFDSNDRGLFLTTKGAVTSTGGLSASNNSVGFGVEIFNDSGDGTGVTLNGTNTFTGNQTDGLIVISEGAITLNAVTATGNGIGASNGLGVHLDNDDDPAHMSNITISGVNNFSGNYSAGLLVQSRGTLSLSSVTASNTVIGVGAELTNLLGEGKAVTLSGTSVFNGNYEQGLLITSHGAVTLSSISASLNGIPGSLSGAVINNSAATAAQMVSLTGTNTFNGNGVVGLSIQSKGLITTNNVTANDNGSSGAYLHNQVGGATAGITMSGVNNILSNGSVFGLAVYSHGAVSVNKITSDGNSSGNGLFVNADGNVTLTCGSFTNNFIGVNVTTTLGTITIKGVVSSGNPGGNYLLSSPFTPVIVRTC